MKVNNKNLLINEMGVWPSFHDAEALSMNFTRGRDPGDYSRLVSKIYLYTTKNINEGTAEFAVIKDKELIVTMQFDDLDSVSLENYNHQNVLQKLKVIDCANTTKVTFESIYGVFCTFSCKTLSVVNVDKVLSRQ